MYTVYIISGPIHVPPSLDMRTVAIPRVMLASGEALVMDSSIVSSLSTRSEGRMVIMRQPLFVPGCMLIVGGTVSTVKSSPSVWIYPLYIYPLKISSYNYSTTSNTK